MRPRHVKINRIRARQCTSNYNGRSVVSYLWDRVARGACSGASDIIFHVAVQHVKLSVEVWADAKLQRAFFAAPVLLFVLTCPSVIVPSIARCPFGE